MTENTSSACDACDTTHYDELHDTDPFVDAFGPDYVVKPAHDDPDLAVVVESAAGDDIVTVVYDGPRGTVVAPTDLADYCVSEGLSTYEYVHTELAFADMDHY